MAHFRCPTSSQLVDNPRLQYANEQTMHYISGQDDDDDDDVSSSSSSTVLAPRTRSSLRKPTTTSSSSSPSPSPLAVALATTTLATEEDPPAIIRPTAARTNSQKTRAAETTQQDDEPRRCWICFGEDEDSDGKWVKPCPCSLVAHEKCLLDWITENQKTSPTKSVQCPQCASTYQLIDSISWSLAVMGVVDEVVHTVSPYLSALGFGISLLVVSTTYGVSSVLLLFGTNEGERILGPPSMWSWRAWVGLPAIPIALLSTQTRWADSTLPFATVLFLRASTANATASNTSNASTGGALGTPFPQLQLSWPPSPLATLGLLPWVRLIYNNVYYATQAMMSRHLKLKLTPPPRRRRSGASILTNQPQQNARRLDNNQQDQPERNPEVDILLGRGRPPSFSAIFTGTLLWPMISNITGSWLSQFKWVREQFPEPFHRNILGGCLFVVVRDIGSLIYRYQKVCQYRSRRIRNYADFSSTSAKRSRRSNRSR